MTRAIEHHLEHDVGIKTGSHVRGTSASPDIPYEDPDHGDYKGHTGKRDLKLPYPAPTNHDDVLPWHVKLMEVIAIGNPRNYEREMVYWGNAWCWKIDDPRFNDRTPFRFVILQSI